MLHPENLVWLNEERTFGYVIGGYGAFYTLVRYRNRDGAVLDVYLENDEFTFIEDLHLEDTHEYEQDDE